MVYGPIGHSWAEWKPKGPARRFTGEETALKVLGSLADDGGSWLGIALRKEGEILGAPRRPKDPLTAAIYDVVMEREKR